MANNPQSLPSPDSQQAPSKNLQKVLAEATDDITNRIGKYPLHCDPTIHLFEIKECIKSIFFQYPEIFIEDFASLDIARQQLLKNEIALLIENRRFHDVKEENLIKIILETRETINLDGVAFYKLFFTVFRTAAVKFFLKHVENAVSFSLLEFSELEKRRSDIVEYSAMEKDVRIEKSKALEKFKESAKRYISSNDVSETISFVHDIFVAHQKGISLEEIEEAVQQETQVLQKKGVVFRSKPEKVVQPPDLSEIPLWPGRKPGPGRKQDTSALDHLKTHYGQHLSAFGAEQDRVFQDQIRAHDRRLIQGLKNQLREERKGRKVSDLVKTRSARVDLELESSSVTDLKRTWRLAATLYTRETRAAKAKATTPSHSMTRK